MGLKTSKTYAIYDQEEEVQNVRNVGKELRQTANDYWNIDNYDRFYNERIYPLISAAAKKGDYKIYVGRGELSKFIKYNRKVWKKFLKQKGLKLKSIENIEFEYYKITWY